MLGRIDSGVEAVNLARRGVVAGCTKGDACSAVNADRLRERGMSAPDA
jgi:hypothetical protein